MANQELITSVQKQLQLLDAGNPIAKKTSLHERSDTQSSKKHQLKKVLIANRGEIAKRFILSLREERIPSVAVVTNADQGQTWYELADEVIMIGEPENYSNIATILAAAILTQSNAIYPGYGFLSENPDFVDAIQIVSDKCHGLVNEPIIFMGPNAQVMRKVGNKLDARRLAKENGVFVFDGSASLSTHDEAVAEADRIGYPVIVKLNAGGGGKGMQPVYRRDDLVAAIQSCQRIGRTLYRDDTYYIEKFITKPVHIEVQIFNAQAIGLRKCAVQRRNQKIIEESADFCLSDHTRLSLFAAAENMARISGYENSGGAGTVEFLYDPDSDTAGFLEMNTRLQVEHPVTDQSLGIDLASWQVLLFDGRQDEILVNQTLEKRFSQKNHTIECRIYAEDPENHYTPSPGKIDELDLPTFNGIRCDFGFRRGDRILPNYDPMIGKLIANGESREEAIVRMERALNELYIRGVITNQYQLLKILRSSAFANIHYTNRILDDHPELSKPLTDLALIRHAVVLAGLCELIRITNEKQNELFLSNDLESILHRHDLLSLPDRFDIEVGEIVYSVRFFQVDLHTFYAYINDQFQGEIELLPALTSGNDYTFRFGHRYSSVRIDRRPSLHILRFPDSAGQIHFLKLKVSALGALNNQDAAGVVRSPIQATFVKLHQEVKLQSKVTKGQPLLVLSAMKMETTIQAPIDGTVSYIIENGSIDKLEIGRTADGYVIGKGITEGEILFMIEPDHTTTVTAVAPLEPLTEVELPAHINQIYKHLFRDDFQEFILLHIDDHLSGLLDICRLYYTGYNTQLTSVIESALGIFKQLPGDYDLSRIFSPSHFVELLRVFIDNKRLFSPIAGGTGSYFREMHRFFGRWNDVTYQLPAPFRYTLQSVFGLHKVNDYRSTAEVDQSIAKTAFVAILRAFHSTRSNAAIIEQVISQISKFRKPSNQLKNLLRKLVVQEEAEQDDSLASLTTETLNKLGVRPWNMEMTYWVSRRYLTDLRKMQNDPLSFSDIDHDSLKQKILSSIQTPILPLIPESIPVLHKEQLKKKIDGLSKRGKVSRLYSPKNDVLVYLFQTSSDQRYFVFGIVDRVVPLLDNDNRIIGSESVERTEINAVRVLHAYQSLHKLHQNIVDIIIIDESVPLDLSSTSPSIYSYQVMRNIVVRMVPFFNDPSIEKNIMTIRVTSARTNRPVCKSIYGIPRQGRVILGLLTDADPANPYSNAEIDPKTRHLFQLGKWPAELWVSECFAEESLTEVKLPSIDGKDDKPATVGSRIYTGTIRAAEAVFYFKDSRIAGGATGDLEGQKYVAACWLAIVKGCPLYVWNDGAGANIKQGMVALNRAAEGFFMNALIGARRSAADAYNTIKRHADTSLLEIIHEINTMYNIVPDQLSKESRAFIVALGVGSSTGLDVYGSSQAAIQMMVDDEQSYRVLTGSAVIKSVTGEDLTNYEIGGAHIMSRVSGTVDRVARSNLHLLILIHEIQELFTMPLDLPAIQRTSIAAAVQHDKDDVLTMPLVKANVDDSVFVQFKEEYYGAGALTGGFGRLAGRPVLVMGPRNKTGLRSYQSLLRASELLISARKLGADQIIVIGDQWFNETPISDAATLKARQDTLKLMTVKSGVQIHIVTSVAGLRKIMLHSACDALIFVNSNEPDGSDLDLINNTATHIVNSLSEAFDLSSQILKLLRPLHQANTDTVFAEPDQPASLPETTGQPFDIITSVIEGVADKHSFIEWWADMNHPVKGPSLVTGFATLAGRPIAIIADQPAIMGGAPDAIGTEKFRIFTELAERCNTPILMLSNAPGFVPGIRQERLRIQQIGGRSLDVNVLTSVPVLSIVLQQNFGGRQIHAFSKFLRPDIHSVAVKDATMAVMGANSAFDLFHKKKYQELLSSNQISEAEALRQGFISEFTTKSRADHDALSTKVLDTVVDSAADLRPYLISAMSSIVSS